MDRVRSRVVLVIALAIVALAAPAAPDRPPRDLGYFNVQPDLRLCPAPFCGGYFVGLLNRRLTRCPDGVEREMCHVAGIDWSAVGLDAEDAARLEQAVLAARGLVRGELRPGGRLDDSGVLAVTEGWIAASGRRPRGRFHRVSETGTVCVTTPCFTLRADLLNTPRRLRVSSLDLTRVGARAATLEAARRMLHSDSILVAGRTVARPNAGPAGRGVELLATQIYLRVRPAQR